MLVDPPSAIDRGHLSNNPESRVMCIYYFARLCLRNTSSSSSLPISVFLRKKFILPKLSLSSLMISFALDEHLVGIELNWTIVVNWEEEEKKRSCIVSSEESLRRYVHGLLIITSKALARSFLFSFFFLSPRPLLLFIMGSLSFSFFVCGLPSSYQGPFRVSSGVDCHQARDVAALKCYSLDVFSSSKLRRVATRTCAPLTLFPHALFFLSFFGLISFYHFFRI